MTSPWDQNKESEFKDTIKCFFDDKINEALRKADNPLEVGSVELVSANVNETCG